ncbi:MAG: hypothetical protein ACXADY_25080 [Candidatus Hodarchaeales archaeon]
MAQVDSEGTWEAQMVEICDQNGGLIAEAQYGEKIIIVSDIDNVNYDEPNDEVEITPVLTADNVTIDAAQRTGPDVNVTSVAPGGTYVIPTIDILDSADAVAEVIEFGDNVKMMDATLTHNLVGTQHQISGPTIVNKPMPISIQHPNTATPWVTGDFVDLFNTGKFDFYDYGTDNVNLMRLGADNRTLHADTPNPWSNTDRWTDTDGNAPTAGQIRWTTFPTGKEYCACDWYHRIMWYQANLGNYAWDTGIAQIQTLNGLSHKGFDDWFVAPMEFYFASAIADPLQPYYQVENAFMRGIVSGYNETQIWMARRSEQFPTNAFEHYSAGDFRRGGYTNTLFRSIYMCRFITDSDSFLP